MQTINKLRKFAEGGKVKKYYLGDALSYLDADEQDDIRNASLAGKIHLDDQERLNYEAWSDAKGDIRGTRQALRQARRSGDTQAVADLETALAEQKQVIKDTRFNGGLKGNLQSNLASFEDTMSSAGAKAGVNIGVQAVNAIDDLAMGDKNFGAQSQAIDDAVHGVSGALMKSGNPYCLIAGAALEGANFLTKAGGQTVQGFDVDINSSGYGDIGHMESSSSRDFGALIGLGGIFNKGKMQAKLAKRNQQAMMAMNAANIANEQSFEQEARANSIQNTIMNNQIALSGGLETSLLGG